MFGRWGNLLIAVWSLHVAPGLCLAGVLAHPCEAAADDPRAPAAVCCATPAEEADDPGSCSHEDDCPEDPCQQTIVLKGGGPRVALESNLPLPAFAAPTLADRDFPTARPKDVPHDEGPRLPLHHSDLPLLI